MTDDKKRKPKRKLHNELAKQRRSRMISELESLPTDQLQSTVEEDVKDLRHLIASRILKERSPEQAAQSGPKKAPAMVAIPKKASKKKVRIKRRIFLKASALCIANLDVEELPFGATKHLPTWLCRFDDSELQSLELQAKAVSVRIVASTLLSNRRKGQCRLTFIAQFRRCSIEELIKIAEHKETGFQVAKEILDRKVYDSLISLTSKELKKISETGSPPLIAKIASSIHSMRHSAPGDGVDSWREQK